MAFQSWKKSERVSPTEMKSHGKGLFCGSSTFVSEVLKAARRASIFSLTENRRHLLKVKLLLEKQKLFGKRISR